MMKRWPWFLTGAFALWIVAAFVPHREGDGFHLQEFGRLPVLLNGRVQPLDSVARNSLLHNNGTVVTHWILQTNVGRVHVKITAEEHRRSRSVARLSISQIT